MSATETYFDLFGLPARYAIDLGQLEERYREKSRRWHPDRYAGAPAAERAQVLARATDLNQAYRTLRSDARRAEYLLRLAGIDVAAEGPENKLRVDPAFLADIMELREELLEAQMSGDAARLAALSAQVRKALTASKQELVADFAKLESQPAPGPEREAALVAVTRTVLCLRYYQRFVDDLDAAAEAELEGQAARAGF